jgi:tetratricopeptide (TPR) repeat protein
MVAFQKAIELAPQLAEAHYELAMTLLATGQQKQALARMGEALRHNPQHANAHRQLGLALMANGKPALALPQFRAVIKERKEDAQAYYEMGLCLVRLGKWEEALAAYREALRLRPEWPEAANQLAWVLSTCPEERFRDGKEAQRLANHGVVLSRRRETLFLDTLAASQAESGQFDAAMATLQLAMDQASALKDEKLAAELEKRRKAYAAKQPFRDGEPEIATAP